MTATKMITAITTRFRFCVVTSFFPQNTELASSGWLLAYITFENYLKLAYFMLDEINYIVDWIFC